MGGKASRDKGSRTERLLVAYLRGLGYEANRIPLSGAMQGFKGDVVAEKDGKKYLFEVKCRHDEFLPLYEAFDKKGVSVQSYSGGGGLYKVTKDFDRLLDFSAERYLATSVSSNPKVFERVFNYKKWLGEAKYLVLKSDRQPFIFVEYI